MGVVESAPELDEEAIGRVFREESGRSLACLVRVFGDIDLAEDAVQDAFAQALRTWPGDGLPPNPGGWITTTARNRAIDRLRRETRGRELLGEAAVLADREQELGRFDDAEPVRDDRLRLIFTCCHPALSPQAQIALTLRLLGGLSTREVADAFLVGEHAMAVRLVRAKRKIKAAHIPYRIPEEHELTDRLPHVLAVVYLIYNAGFGGTAEPGLCAEAIRLARVLAEVMPDETEVDGLLALLLLTESRRSSRIRPDGSLAPLAEQERAGWDRALIDEGQAIVRRCLRRDQPGPYQLQAAINAVHADAAAIEETDWAQILALYDQLLAIAPTPVVALNRAVAVAEVEGPAAALALIEDLDLEDYQAFHATRADLLRRLGRDEKARAAYGRAAELAPTEAERAYLVRRRRGASAPRRGTGASSATGSRSGGSARG